MTNLVRQSARSLALRPGFSVLVLLILALCIGGSASVFSAAKAVLFRDLAYKDADRLVVLSMFYLPNSSDTDLSWLESEDWRRRTALLEDVSPFLCYQDRLVMQGDSVERIGVNYVPSSYLKMLGVQPRLGRLFTPQEDGPPGSAPFIILSHHLWERLWQKNPGIVGQKIVLNNEPYTVVGVMPEGLYDFPQGRWEVDAWIPANMAGASFLPNEPPIFTSREERLWFSLARLKPGVTIEQAQQEADAFATDLQRQYPDTNKDYGARVLPLREFMFEDMEAGMKILLAGAGLVMLIGCANIANLLLVRVAERRRDLSLRLALGANRWRLIQQVLAESLILAILGGALGALLAVWGTKLMVGLLDLPPFTKIELDGQILAITILGTVLTGLLFGLPPALSVARMDSKGTLQQIRTAGGRTHSSRGRNSLIVFQVAIVVVLLIVAGLLLRSFWRLQTTGVDFETARLLSMRLSFESERYEERPAMAAAQKELLRLLDGAPGVQAAGIWGPAMPGIMTTFTEVAREGAPAEAAPIRADLHCVSPGALKVLGVPLLKGREFTQDDIYEGPRVAVITKSLADILWPGQDPIGKRLVRPTREPDVPVTVVGLIPNVRFQGRFVEGNHHILFSLGQRPTADTNLIVRASIDSASVTRSVRDAIRKVDSQVPLYDIHTIEERMREQERSQRLNAAIVGLYAFLALLLALLGLYGMLAYSVVQRTQEIGLRMALGANRNGVLGLVMGRGLALVCGGLVLGVAGALVLTRLLSSQLFGVTARDPFTFAGVVLVFIAVASLATYLPARRAVKVEPTIALRYE